MSFPRDVFIDLLTISKSAPYSGARIAANVLMARELIARRCADGFAVTDREKGPYSTFYWQDLEGASTAPGLDALLYVNPLASAAQRLPAGGYGGQRGDYYLYFPNGWSACVIGPTFPFGPYDAVLKDAVSRAAQLRTAVIDGVTIGAVSVFAGMGSTAFDAARAPYVDYFAAYDFAASRIFAYYGFGGDTTAAANATFPLQNFTLEAPGYNEITPPQTPEIIVPASGSYSVQTEGYIRSASTANPTTITLSLRVSGVEVASRSVVRNSADPTEAVRLDRQIDVVTIDGPFTVVNSSASTESGPVSIKLWKNP